jgi:long-chain acyl-CoA synthetase
MAKNEFTEMLLVGLTCNWDKDAFSDYEGETYKFSEVAEWIARWHIIFERNGLKKGDKVSFLGKNSRNWAVSYMASSLYGAVTVPILPDFHKSDIAHIVEHSDSKILFCEEALYEKLDKDDFKGLDAIVKLGDFTIIGGKKKAYKKDLEDINKLFEEKYPSGLTADNFSTPEVGIDDIVTINYTSGTSGHTKGVVLEYRSFLANLKYARENMPLEPGERIVSFLPLAHTYGCAFDFIFPFSIGCHITFLGKIPSPQVILKAFQSIKPHLVMFVPLVLEKIYKSRLQPVLNKPAMKILTHIPGVNRIIFKKINASLTESFGGNFREIVIGGAALNKQVEKFLTKIRFKFAIGYGMTECGPLISYDGWKTRKLTSAGKPVDSLELKIDSENPQKEVGEIMVKGDNVMVEYYKNPEATKAALTEDGWLRTGDLGLLDKDNYVFIKGRSKAMILGPSGQNIYPEIVEGRINNLPYVIESIVVERKERLVALILPDLEAMKNDGIEGEEINEVMEKNRHHLNNHLPKFMQVVKFEMVEEEFEKTPKKSIKRFKYS